MNVAKKSPREEAQDRLVDFLENDVRDGRRQWTAPFGIMGGLSPLKNGGKVRVVTFGVAATLDATAFIWSTDRITFDVRGPLSVRFTTTEFQSVDAAIEFLKTV